MLRNAWRSSVSGLLAVCLFGMLVTSLIAQTAATGTLRGTVTDASGTVVPNAIVTATSVDIGQARSATTRPDGTYKFQLPPSNYRLKFEAAGFKTIEVPSTTVSGTEVSVLDEKLEVGEQINGKPSAAPQDNLPNAPSSSSTAPSLSDLGISPEQTQGNAREQGFA